MINKYWFEPGLGSDVMVQGAVCIWKWIAWCCAEAVAFKPRSALIKCFVEPDGTVCNNSKMHSASLLTSEHSSV